MISTVSIVSLPIFIWFGCSEMFRIFVLVKLITMPALSSLPCKILIQHELKPQNSPEGAKFCQRLLCYLCDDVYHLVQGIFFSGRPKSFAKWTMFFYPYSIPERQCSHVFTLFTDPEWAFCSELNMNFVILMHNLTFAGVVWRRIIVTANTRRMNFNPTVAKESWNQRRWAAVRSSKLCSVVN